MKHQLNLLVSAAFLAVAARGVSAQNATTVAATPGTPQPPNVYVAAPTQLVPFADDDEWYVGGKSGSAASRTLILPKEAIDTRSLSETEEDFKVMMHILEKAAISHDEKGRQAMGITILNGRAGGSGVPRNLYLEGYGALFFLNVNFPLVAPPAKGAEAESKENTSSEWEEARRELNRPTGWDFQLFNPAEPFAAESTTEEFDADKVDDLKKNLITALKNAAHIRKLKSDETVTIIVTGRDANPRPRVFSRKSGGGGGVVYAPRATRTAGDARGSRLILRARKSDIEAFQKDKTDLDDFRKQVTVMIY